MSKFSLSGPLLTLFASMAMISLFSGAGHAGIINLRFPERPLFIEDVPVSWETIVPTRTALLWKGASTAHWRKLEDSAYRTRHRIVIPHQLQGEYIFKIAAFDKDGRAYETEELSFAVQGYVPPRREEMRLKVEKIGPTGYQGMYSVAAGDLDGDGADEFVITGHNPSPDGWLRAFNGKGGLLWGVRLDKALHVEVKDVDLDGRNEVLAGWYGPGDSGRDQATGRQGGLALLEGDGRARWINHSPATHHVHAGDVAGDSNPEILQDTCSSGLHVLTNSGQRIITIQYVDVNDHPVLVGNFLGDDGMEILYGSSEEKKSHIVDVNGKILWEAEKVGYVRGADRGQLDDDIYDEFVLAPQGRTYALIFKSLDEEPILFHTGDEPDTPDEHPVSVTIGDLDGDGSNEIIIGTGRGDVEHRMFIINPDGELLWENSGKVKNCCMGAAIGDFNGDGKKEIVGISHKDRSIYLFEPY